MFAKTVASSLQTPSSGGGGGVNSVEFDGVNDFYEVEGVGLSDAYTPDNKLTFSFFVYGNQPPAQFSMVFGCATYADGAPFTNNVSLIWLHQRDNGEYFVRCSPDGAGLLVRWAFTPNNLVADELNHIMMMWDGSQTVFNDRVECFVNGVNQNVAPQQGNATQNFDFRQSANPDTQWSLGGYYFDGGSQKWDGQISDFWFDTVAINPLVPANIDLFRTPDGCPADLGADGSLPTGRQPAVYQKGPASDWNAGTHQGAIQGWTMTGAVVDGNTGSCS